MNGVFQALVPRLDKKLQESLKNAYYESSDGMLVLKQFLEEKHGLKSVWAQGPVTIDNLEQAFSITKHAGYTPDIRLLNLIYCAAGGKDSIGRPDSYPETEAFAQSLTSLPDEDRQVWANSLIEKFGHHLHPFILKKVAGQTIGALKKICAGELVLGDDWPGTASD
jgi:hypothetical protein